MDGWMDGCMWGDDRVMRSNMHKANGGEVSCGWALVNNQRAFKLCRVQAAATRDRTRNSRGRASGITII